MARAIRLSVAAMVAGTLVGCGTFSDAMCGPIYRDAVAADGHPIDKHVFYRGVQFDVLAIKEDNLAAFALADLPFSAVADTLLIPHCLYVYVHRESNQNNREVTNPDGRAPATRPASNAPSHNPSDTSPQAGQGTPGQEKQQLPLP
jgi:uncharacterized protein YceK